MYNKIHILHKYRFLDGNINTIIEHIHVLEDKGGVWWGLIGRGILKKRTDELIDQLENNFKTKVILTTTNDQGKRIFHEGILSNIITYSDYCNPGKNDSDERELIPEYYRDENHITWLKFSNIIELDSSIIHKFSLRTRPNENLVNPLKSQSSIMYLIEK